MLILLLFFFFLLCLCYTVVARSSVRLLTQISQKPGHHAMDPEQILWEAIYPPYLQTAFSIFFFFFLIFRF